MAKKMKYRLLSLAMAVVMAFTLLPAAALAEEVQPEEEPAVCRELEGFREADTYRVEGLGPEGTCFTALCVFQ